MPCSISALKCPIYPNLGHAYGLILSLEVLVIVFKGKNSTLHQKNFSMVMMLLKEQVDNDWLEIKCNS